ncbi:MAG: serine hydrolase domain-containing protein [Pseudohongiellaceae bacterium]
MNKLVMIFGIWLFGSTSLMASENWDNFDQLEANVQAGDYGTVTSVLIMERGEVVYEGYFNQAAADTLHNTRSVTKTITSMAVGAAVDEGLLSITSPAAELFSDIQPFENPDPRKSKITIEDMLTMSSILECNDNDSYSRGNESRMSIVEDWTSFYWDLPIRGFPSWVETPDSAKYGRAFAYCSAGVEIAGQAVERATGIRFQDYVADKIFQPMGIDQFKFQENGLGGAHKSGGLGLTSRGLAALAEMQRNGGTYNGKRVLSESWTREAVTPRAVVYSDSGVEYGYLWWLAPYSVSDQRYNSYYMTGNGGNRVAVLPAYELVVVVTKTDFNQRGMHQATDKLLEQEIYTRLSQ